MNAAYPIRIQLSFPREEHEWTVVDPSVLGRPFDANAKSNGMQKTEDCNSTHSDTLKRVLPRVRTRSRGHTN